ncbi:TIGR00730 family Rossman fold protein [Pararhizobium haloflavum]|uniref:LOG family protein n=1 Tax=Pararhizobium haloflavum TaxID=2037914 RepID=UPI000C193BA1|nr:TIGR00730 family Rossman fold protein [Pararhizobium haloflavum]
MSQTFKEIRSICVYCGSQPGRDEAYRAAGKALGRAIAAHGMRLVYGGGTRGVMGAVADGVMSGGGAVTGIIPEFLMEKEATKHALGQLDELVVTADMHQRKHTMFERSDAFVTLPGGIGTLEEIVEIMTWAQLGRHTKPMVLADIGGFWDPLVRLMDHMSAEGFLHTAHLVKPLVISKVDDIVPAIIAAAASNGGSGESRIIERM